MLSRREKQELLQDGLSLRRRNNFRKTNLLIKSRKTTLDGYIHFLMELQKVSPFKVSRENINTAFNKL